MACFTYTTLENVDRSTVAHEGAFDRFGRQYGHTVSIDLTSCAISDRGYGYSRDTINTPYRVTLRSARAGVAYGSGYTQEYFATEAEARAFITKKIVGFAKAALKSSKADLAKLEARKARQAA